jgi:hypothetical protein
MFGSFLKKIKIKKFGKMCFPCINSTNFGETIRQFSYEKNLDRKPYYEGYSWKISPKFTRFQKVEKIQKLPLFNDKFHWLTKYIEFFFGNFHIWHGHALDLCPKRNSINNNNKNNNCCYATNPTKYSRKN